MKALFGVVSLLVALAIVGMIGAKQLKAVGHAAQPTPAAAAANADVPPAPMMSGSGTVREQTVGLENKVANDIAKAVSAGAAAREEQANKAGSAP
jgi:hypothetical protein